MSKALKQEQRVDEIRRERRVQLPVKPSPASPAQATPLLLTYVPRVSPVPAEAAPIVVRAPFRRWRLWLQPGLGLASVALAFLTLVMVVPGRPDRAPAPVAQGGPVRIASLASHPAPQSTDPVSHAVPANPIMLQAVDQRSVEMSRALEEAKRAIVLMDEAMRHAAWVYAATRSPSNQPRPQS